MPTDSLHDIDRAAADLIAHVARIDELERRIERALQEIATTSSAAKTLSAIVGLNICAVGLHRIGTILRGDGDV